MWKCNWAEIDCIEGEQGGFDVLEKERLFCSHSIKRVGEMRNLVRGH